MQLPSYLNYTKIQSKNAIVINIQKKKNKRLEKIDQISNIIIKVKRTYLRQIPKTENIKKQDRQQTDRWDKE